MANEAGAFKGQSGLQYGLGLTRSLQTSLCVKSQVGFAANCILTAVMVKVMTLVGAFGNGSAALYYTGKAIYNFFGNKQVAMHSGKVAGAHMRLCIEDVVMFAVLSLPVVGLMVRAALAGLNSLMGDREVAALFANIHKGLGQA